MTLVPVDSEAGNICREAPMMTIWGEGAEHRPDTGALPE
jgi:hypothetical protein